MESTKTPAIILISFGIILNVIFKPKIVLAHFTFEHEWCGNSTYKPHSAYQSNLQSVLNSLSSDTQITYGFYNFSAGKDPDRVSSLAICRGDVPVNSCRLCISNSANLLPQACPNRKQAFGYSNYCSIFISNGLTYGKLQQIPPWHNTSAEKFYYMDSFNNYLSSLMSNLKNGAASGDSRLKFATGNVSITVGLTLYGLVQCTPDLSRQSCMQCIQGSLSFLPICCINHNYIYYWVEVVEPNCYIQYNFHPFFGNLPDSPPPQRPSNSSTLPKPVGKSKKSSNVRVVTPVLIVVSTILVMIIVLCMRSKKEPQKSRKERFNEDELDTLQSLQFSFGAVKQATHDFSKDNKLGQGGFGAVYKGVLPDGRELAVKRLLRKSGQGDVEFKNEILLLVKLQHKNLVKLLGFCLHEKEMILIYEFVANRSLDNFIFGQIKQETISWEERYKIINGVARGLLYLHEGSRLKIIHRDLKPGNILLDAEFNPKIADFGMARLFNINETQSTASKICGTLGYMSPEYVFHGQVSVKSDVYSFGVLVLEIISGKKITSVLDEENYENLLSFVWRNWLEGTIRNVVDSALPTNCSMDIKKCIHIGLLCVQDNAANRPNMSCVNLMLSTYSPSLQMPSEPAFLMESNGLYNLSFQRHTTTQSSNTSTGKHSINGITLTEFYPR